MNSGDTEASLVSRHAHATVSPLVTTHHGEYIQYTLHLHGMAKDDIQCRKVYFCKASQKSSAFKTDLYHTLSRIFVMLLTKIYLFQ